MMVYVTDTGIVSAIGLNTTENFNALKSLRGGVIKSALKEGTPEIYHAPVGSSNAVLMKQFGVADVPHSRTSLLGIAAVTEAWKNRELRDDIRTGFISATSVGGMDKTENYDGRVLNNEAPDFDLVSTHDSGSTTEKIANHFGFKGYVNTISTACSSAANAIMLGARLIEAGHLDRVVVGGTDPLTDFTVKGFQSLMIYDTEWCKPFDEARNGLNLGEGAAFLVLENEKSMQLSASTPLCRITGWCNAADAYHQTASSPEGKGATLAMRGALKKAGVLPEQVGYINAHGTGTKNNDLSESVALKNIFGEQLPPFSSTKAFTGHTLAAAGAIEAVFSVLSLVHHALLPAINFKTPVAETQLIPQTTFQTIDVVNAVLSNSFGFGGNNSSLLFQKV